MKAQPGNCTLDEPAFRVREQEFRELFARGLLQVRQANSRSATLTFDRAHEAGLRDLLARELQCCSFFDFEILPESQTVSVTVRVPAGSEAALALLLGLSPAGTAYC